MYDGTKEAEQSGMGRVFAKMVLDRKLILRKYSTHMEADVLRKQCCIVNI